MEGTRRKHSVLKREIDSFFLLLPSLSIRLCEGQKQWRHKVGKGKNSFVFYNFFLTKSFNWPIFCNPKNHLSIFREGNVDMNNNNKTSLSYLAFRRIGVTFISDKIIISFLCREMGRGSTFRKSRTHTYLLFKQLLSIFCWLVKS